jgi:basic membrane lipoprotein Med (substrate-binding protein (PBP1-ABC) superfamily)
VDPSIKTKVVLTNNWYNPPQSTQAAETLASSGTDVVAKHMDDIGACLGAKAAGVYCIGSEADTSAQTPSTYLTGSVYNWNSYARKKYEQAINSVVPASVKAKVAAAQKQLESGKLIVFKGPIYSNTGKLMLPAGQSWSTPAQVYAHMTFYAQGIIGTLQH